MAIKLLTTKHVSSHSGQARGSARKKKRTKEKNEDLGKRVAESGKSVADLRKEDQEAIDAIRGASFVQGMKSLPRGFLSRHEW